MTSRLSLDAYRREMGLGPVDPAPGWRGTGGQRTSRDEAAGCVTLATLPAQRFYTAVAPEPASNRGNKSRDAAPPVAGSHDIGPVGMRRGRGGHKYAAVATDGPDGAGGVRRYQSKKGARLAQRLETERHAGGIVAWVPEVGITVGTLGTRAVRHLVDALVILSVEPDGSFHGRFVEAKGFRVRAGERKRKALEQRLGVKVEVV